MYKNNVISHIDKNQDEFCVMCPVLYLEWLKKLWFENPSYQIIEENEIQMDIKRKVLML